MRPKIGFICFLIMWNIRWKFLCEIHPPIHEKEIWKPDLHTSESPIFPCYSKCIKRACMPHCTMFSYAVVIPFSIENLIIYFVLLKFNCRLSTCTYVDWNVYECTAYSSFCISHQKASFLSIEWYISAAEGAWVHLLCSEITRLQLWSRSWRTSRTNFWLWKTQGKRSNGHTDPNIKFNQ